MGEDTGPKRPGEVTRMLRRLEAGQREAYADLLPLVYDELLGLAERQMARERLDHTLQRTALVHEAYLRLVRKAAPQFRDRRHFLRAAATVMRSILVNHARDRGRQKRGGGARRVTWQDDLAGVAERSIDLVDLDEALTKLEAIDVRQVEVIECRFFAGLTVEETAEAMRVSPRTVHADWSLSRAWLLRELEAGSTSSGG